MKKLKKILLVVCVLILTIILLFSFNIIWKSPPYYNIKKYTELKKPIMDMEHYNKISKNHRRPYSYTIKSKTGGEAHVLGIDHTKDENNSQLDTLQHLWNKVKPTVALVEGRLGFLFSWFQSPIQRYGESGLASLLAKNDGVKLFTWEPSKEDEINILMNEFSVDKIAMFYAFRPYFSNLRFGKPKNSEEKLQEYLESRTNYKHIKGIYNSWEQLDSIWKKDYPNHLDWRLYSDVIGWPEGYLSDIANKSNLIRDEHLVQIIIDLVNQGEVVFITMGTSHAPRIEEVLNTTIK